MISRGRSIAMIGAAMLLPSCAQYKPGTIRVASTTDATNENVAEVYAYALEREGFPVERRMRIGDDAALRAALARDEIDLFPARVPVGTKASATPGVTVLDSAPAGQGDTLATSQFVAQKLYLVSTESCARLAPTLRLAATAEFVKPGGMLSRLQAAYGGFLFRSIKVCDPDAQTNLLNRELADVSHISNVDPQVHEGNFVLLRDEKHVFPLVTTAPYVTTAALQTHPNLPGALNRVSRGLNLYAMQDLNMHRDLNGMSARDAAEEFVYVYLKKR